MNKYSDFIIRYRWLVIILVTLFTLFFVYQLTKIKVDSNIINSLPQDDPEVSLFKEVGKVFGSNEIGMIIIKAENVLQPQVLDDIELITESISETEGVLSVTSLTTMMNIEVTEDDFMVGNLINENNRPNNKEEADSLLSIVSKNEMVVGTLMAKDGSSSVIIFSFLGDADIQNVSLGLMSKIDSLNLSEPYYFAGAPFMRSYVSKVVSHDISTLIPISFLVISLLLYLSFHSFRGIFLPLLTAGLAIVWGIGTFALFGIKLSMVSNNVPIIILAVGTAYAIHILNRVDHCKEKEYKKCIKVSLSLMAVPVSLTALTTMVGFLSFIFGAYLTLIRDFGILAALGTFFSGLLAVTFVPALLAILPAKKQNEESDSTQKHTSLLVKYYLSPIARSVIKNPRRVLLIWILVFVVLVGGIFNIKRSVSIAGYFKNSHPVSISEEILSKDYGGTKPIFIVVTGDMQSPEVLKAMMDLENYMKESPLIGSTQSITNIMGKLNLLFNGEDKVPDDEATIGQLWYLLGQQENIKNLVTSDLDQAVIVAKFQDMGDNSTTDVNTYIRDYFDNHPSDSYTMKMTGMPFINAKLSDNLLYSQIASLIIAMILVMAIVSFMLGSFMKGLFASLPIIGTIGIMYGVMGFTGIPLNIVTVLVASIAMGIGIDYSIHFFSYYNHSLKNGMSLQNAINESIQVSGKAIIINFISVSIGFLSLIFSDLVPMIYFGIIIALSMFGASMGALTLLPSILLIKKKKETSE